MLRSTATLKISNPNNLPTPFSNYNHVRHKGYPTKCFLSNLHTQPSNCTMSEQASTNASQSSLPVHDATPPFDEFWRGNIPLWSANHQAQITHHFSEFFFNNFRQIWFMNGEEPSPLYKHVHIFFSHHIQQSIGSENQNLFQWRMLWFKSMWNLKESLITFLQMNPKNLSYTDERTRRFRKALETAITRLKDNTSDDCLRRCITDWEPSFWTDKTWDWPNIEQWAISPPSNFEPSSLPAASLTQAGSNRDDVPTYSDDSDGSEFPPALDPNPLIALENAQRGPLCFPSTAGTSFTSTWPS